MVFLSLFLSALDSFFFSVLFNEVRFTWKVVVHLGKEIQVAVLFARSGTSVRRLVVHVCIVVGKCASFLPICSSFFLFSTLLYGCISCVTRLRTELIDQI